VNFFYLASSVGLTLICTVVRVLLVFRSLCFLLRFVFIYILAVNVFT